MALFFRGSLILAFVITGPSLLGQSGLPSAHADFTITKRLLSIENGLASHEVFCGLQDAAGFMWFGTRNGLNRYDGKECLLFTRQRNKLQDNKVVQLAKDDANHLFIEYGSTGFQLATNGKVDVMNAQSQEVKTLTEAFPNLPFKEQDVYWIANDGSNEVNFLTAFPFRLWKYSSKSGFRLHFEMKGWDRTDPSFDYRVTGPVCTFGNGKALLKITNQAPQYLTTNDTVFAFTQKDVLRSLPIGFTRDNHLLLTYNTKTEVDSFAVGLVTRKGRLESVPDLRKYKLDAIKGRYWYQIVVATNGLSSILYISTDALYVWNETTFLKVLSKSDLKGFENLFIYRLFPDNLGNLWLCTSLGVLQLKIEKNRFEPYFSSRQQSLQPNSQARGIYADQTGQVMANIWTHTFRQQNGKMQAVAESNEEIKYAVARHQSGLYVGGYHLFRYDETRNAITALPGGQGSEIWSMFSVNDSLLLLGRTNGFSRFNSHTRQFDTVSTPNAPEARFVYRFFRGKGGVVWAVAENGLYTLSIDQGRLTMVKLQSPFLSGLSLLDAYQDADGIFWLATSGEGLYRWDPKTHAIRQFTITAGFPSDVLYRIEPDEFGQLWISSDNGLIRFHRKTFSVNTYTTVDGLSHNEFNRTSSFKADDGRLFFGGLDGVNAFDPRDFRADTNSLRVPLQLIAFNQFVGSQNKLVSKTAELLRTSNIILEPDDQFFTLEFQLLDFTKEEGHRYAYKIEGIDQDWNYLTENSIRISGLPYGTFTLRIKGQNGEGAWSQRELTIPLTVLKPFYLQWWFIVGMAMLFLLTVYFYIRFRINQLAADKKKLEQTVNERTAQLKQSLSEQSALLLEKDVLMKEIHHRVKNNLQVISGLLELQSKGLADETAREALREGQNRVRSIALIHQNLYQFENLSTIDLKRFINDLCRQIQSVYQKQKPVTIDITVPDLHLDIDSAVPLGLILNELLSNSFKYAFAGVAAGEIKLAIQSTSGGKYQLRYADNGPGLPSDFDPAKAKTLGLQLVNDLSRQIGGKVQYATQNGAVYTIQFTNRETRKNED
ncbi:histidine kinase dimerization/phosphoacceptor domain -containing protein [Larkinella knui]|uniref:histidine kinase dimerization/phosphoacceptor domain -containing protein n=1 Tax=Larkinella knui TaxID=2025310 RepID=UPI001639B7AF|nr:histidine kinase dimerization/phosphoacceptor domain -containing protein [Larkinella knui]